jgi:hypothetical protein
LTKKAVPFLKMEMELVLKSFVTSWAWMLIVRKKRAGRRRYLSMVKVFVECFDLKILKGFRNVLPHQQLPPSTIAD